MKPEISDTTSACTLFCINLSCGSYKQFLDYYKENNLFNNFFKNLEGHVKRVR